MVAPHTRTGSRIDRGGDRNVEVEKERTDILTATLQTLSRSLFESSRCIDVPV